MVVLHFLSHRTSGAATIARTSCPAASVAGWEPSQPARKPASQPESQPASHPPTSQPGSQAARQPASQPASQFQPTRVIPSQPATAASQVLPRRLAQTCSYHYKARSRHRRRAGRGTLQHSKCVAQGADAIVVHCPSVLCTLDSRP